MNKPEISLDRNLALDLVRVTEAAALGDIRWFFPRTIKPGSGPPFAWQTQGLPGWLTLVNAVEGHRPPGSPSRLSRADPDHATRLVFQLTVINQRALVLFGWPDAAAPAGPAAAALPSRHGALLCSDAKHPTSRLHYEIPWTHVAMMSAPHHGSCDPDHDGFWPGKPADAVVLLSNNIRCTRSDFFGVPGAQRGCTSCAARSWPVPVNVRASETSSTWAVSPDCHGACGGSR